MASAAALKTQAGAARPADAHTPTPWHAHVQSTGHGDGLYDPKVCICTTKPAAQYDSPVAEQIAWTVGSNFIYGSERYKADTAKNIANAAFIVRAVNAHDDLVKALRDVEKATAEYDPNSRIGIINEIVRAALAKAGGAS